MGLIETKEALMTALYDQIQLLRLELGANTDADERAIIAAELAAAEAQHAAEIADWFADD